MAFFLRCNGRSECNACNECNGCNAAPHSPGGRQSDARETLETSREFGRGLDGSRLGSSMPLCMLCTLCMLCGSPAAPEGRETLLTPQRALLDGWRKCEWARETAEFSTNSIDRRASPPPRCWLARLGLCGVM